MPILTITTHAGTSHEVPFDPSSTLIVQGEAGGITISDVASVAIADAPAEQPAEQPAAPADPVPADTATVEQDTPHEAIAHALTLELADAAAHIDAALAKWPDDADLLAARSGIAAALDAG